MAKPRIRVGGQWKFTGRKRDTTPFVVGLLQPSSDGLAFELPFTAAGSVSDPSRLSKLQLVEKTPGASVATIVGETTAPLSSGLYVISTPPGMAPGVYELWLRAILNDGQTVDSVHRQADLQGMAPPLRLNMLRPAISGDSGELPYEVVMSVTDPSVVDNLELFHVTSDAAIIMAQPRIATTYSARGDYIFSAAATSTEINNRIRRVRFYGKYDPVEFVNNLGAEFSARKAWALDQLVAITGPSGDPPDWQVGRGIAKLEKAKGMAAGSAKDALVTAGNSDVQAGCTYFDASKNATGTERQSLTRIIHAGPLILCRAYLRFNPLGLLTATTKTAIKNSLASLRDAAWDELADFQLGIMNSSFVPYRPYNSARGFADTENHKISVIVGAFLMTEVFAGDAIGQATADTWKAGNGTNWRIRRSADSANTSASLSLWHYFRDAIYRYDSLWVGSFIDHLRKDVPGQEYSATSYHHVYLGDYLAIRDFSSDAALRQHAENIVDRLLAEYVETSAKGVWGGPHARAYHADHQSSGPHHAWVWLLFDCMRVRPPAGDWNLGWARWCHWGWLSTDYNPTASSFPKPLLETAWQKRGGYDVKRCDEPEHGRVERDFVLGFCVKGLVETQATAGGAIVPQGQKSCIAMPFHGSGPFNKNKPTRDARGIMAGRVAVQRYLEPGMNPRLWLSANVNNGLPWETVEIVANWLFLRAKGTEGRWIFVAVRQAGGTISTVNLTGTASSDPDAGAGDDAAGGVTYQFSIEDAPLVWEIATQDDYPVAGADAAAQRAAAWAAFKTDIQNNTITVTSTTTSYASSKAGVTLVWHKNDDDHVISPYGTVRWQDYDRSNGSPLMNAIHNTNTARFGTDVHEVAYDWDTDPADLVTAGTTVGNVAVGEVPSKTTPTPGAVFAGPREDIYLGTSEVGTLGWAGEIIDTARLPKATYLVYPVATLDDGTTITGPTVPWTLGGV